MSSLLKSDWLNTFVVLITNPEFVGPIVLGSVCGFFFILVIYQGSKGFSLKFEYGKLVGKVSFKKAAAQDIIGTLVFGVVGFIVLIGSIYMLVTKSYL